MTIPEKSSSGNGLPGANSAGEIDAKTVQSLRERTGAGMMDCKKALLEAQGNIDRAVEILRQKNIASAGKRAEKSANQGLIFSYIHPGSQLGVLLEINCETDFVAKTADFQNLAKELCMQVAAASPRWVSASSVPAEVLEQEKRIYRAQVPSDGKSPETVEKILNGKLVKFYEQWCLLDQLYIRDSSGKTKVSSLIDEASGKLGEKIQVRRFVRFKLGEEV